MDVNANQKIKRQLEDLYDIPFDVDGGYHYKDPWFHVRPHNSEDSCDLLLRSHLKNMQRFP